jgi:phosphomannomutase
MNRVTVARATAGFASWLTKQMPDASSRGIVVGRDARRNSDAFEREVIQVLSGAGIPVWVFDDVVPTPVLAFAVLKVRAAGGVMITASHNPAGYNGYKVYWENAAQIIPPHDQGIAGEVEHAPSALEIPRVSVEEAERLGLLRKADALRGEYIEEIASELRRLEREPQLRIAYTALHGVAEGTFRAVMARAGFDEVQSVSEQSVPDGSFPTVAFPNPEEPGAMDRVLDLAQRIDADLAIANDPDGDRVGVAVRCETGFEMLSGNEIGILLADDLLSLRTGSGQPLVISTIVSSPMMGPVAASHGARWEQTLSGHKWIQNRALELMDQGLDYVFGYEEALGYAPSRAVRDKDGISSALRIADMASRLKARGETLLDARAELWGKHGCFVDRQVSVKFEGAEAQARMSAVVDRFRNSTPARIGGLPVLRMLDLDRQLQWTPLGVRSFAELPRSNVLVFELQGGHRLMLRPSGTEPKLKYYFYATAPHRADGELSASKAKALAILDRMIEDVRDASDC